jgi:hypothetical protein
MLGAGTTGDVIASMLADATRLRIVHVVKGATLQRKPVRAAQGGCAASAL